MAIGAMKIRAVVACACGNKCFVETTVAPEQVSATGFSNVSLGTQDIQCPGCMKTLTVVLTMELTVKGVASVKPDA